MQTKKILPKKKEHSALLYLKDIIDTLRENFLILDSELKVIVANELFYKTFDITKKNTEGKVIFDLGDGHWNIPSLKKVLLEIIPNKKKITDFKITHSFNGSVGKKIILINAKEIDDSKIIIVSIEDVTAEKSQENKITQHVKVLAEKIKELSEAKAKDEAILLSLGDALVVVDKIGKIEFVNKAFEELLGWTQSEVLGKFMVEVIPREDETGLEVPFVERILSEVLAGKKITTSTIESKDPNAPIVVLPPYYYIRKNKTRFPATGFINPILLGDKVIGAVETFRDITKEKELDKTKSDFISLAAHQLRTPLSAVSWYTEMLLSGDAGELNENQKKYFEQIYNGSIRMVEMVKSFLNVSLLDIENTIIHKENTNIPELFQNVIDEQQQNIIEKQIDLDLHIVGNIPMIALDKKRIRMVLQNLVSNAVKYIHKKGKVQITINAAHEKYRQMMFFSVQDNGFGIPEHSKNKIFTKFFRADNVTDRSTDGTGLGMYLAKNIIESSGGKIWFESTENIGTTFYVTLPL